VPHTYVDDEQFMPLRRFWCNSKEHESWKRKVC